jgi:hypothetical protein
MSSQHRAKQTNTGAITMKDNFNIEDRKKLILKIANKIMQCQKTIKTLKDKQMILIESLYLSVLQSKIVKLQNLDFDLVLHTLDDAGLLITENNTIETFNPKKHLKLIRA